MMRYGRRSTTVSKERRGYGSGSAPVTLSPPARRMSSLISVPRPGAISGFGHTTYRTRGRGAPEIARGLGSAPRPHPPAPRPGSVPPTEAAPGRLDGLQTGLEVDRAAPVDGEPQRHQPL